jgi:hypothetical protein
MFDETVPLTVTPFTVEFGRATPIAPPPGLLLTTATLFSVTLLTDPEVCNSPTRPPPKPAVVVTFGEFKIRLDTEPDTYENNPLY